MLAFVPVRAREIAAIYGLDFGISPGELIEYLRLELRCSAINRVAPFVTLVVLRGKVIEGAFAVEPFARHSESSAKACSECALDGVHMDRIIEQVPRADRCWEHVAPDVMRAGPARGAILDDLAKT